MTNQLLKPPCWRINWTTATGRSGARNAADKQWPTTADVVKAVVMTLFVERAENGFASNGAISR